MSKSLANLAFLASPMKTGMMCDLPGSTGIFFSANLLLIELVTE